MLFLTSHTLTSLAIHEQLIVVGMTSAQIYNTNIQRAAKGKYQVSGSCVGEGRQWSGVRGYEVPDTR